MLSFIQFLSESRNNIITAYHGSNIPNLTSLKPKSNNTWTIPPSIFLSSKKSVAKDYGRFIYKCRISCNNTKEIDVHGQSFHDYRQFEYQIYEAYDDGHDCVVFRNIMDSKEPGTRVALSDIYVVFDSGNVEVTGQL